jgi:hypothetical protein
MRGQRLSIETLKQLLRCDMETGKLFWLPRAPAMFPEGRHGAIHNAAKWNARWAGKEALTAVDNNGYRIGSILGAQYRAHCVVWALQHGYWPTEQIDHVDHNRSNGGITNLREASHTENAKNHTLHRNNKSGFNGVSWDKNLRKWAAKIRNAGRQIHLGYFVDIGDAIAARESANAKYGFHPNHGRAR